MDPVAVRAIRGWLRSGSELDLEVVSGSMAPTLVAGEQVRVVPVELAALRTGDVVVLESGGRYVVHRLMCRHLQWRTAGDACSYLDVRLDPALIVGRVTGVRRDLHWYSLPSYPGGLSPVFRWGFASLAHRMRSVIE
jgi:hypothetical protein